MLAWIPACAGAAWIPACARIRLCGVRGADAERPSEASEPPLAIVGDTLFAGSIGRVDFPTSDAEALKRSLREVLLSLPDATRVLPGHGPETTIGEEKATNPFLA